MLAGAAHVRHVEKNSSEVEATVDVAVAVGAVAAVVGFTIAFHRAAVAAVVGFTSLFSGFNVLLLQLC